MASHPDFERLREWIDRIPILRNERNRDGVHLNGELVVAVNWEVREAIWAAESSGGTYQGKLSNASGRDWGRFLKKRLPRSGLLPHQIVPLIAYERGLELMRQNLPSVDFSQVLSLV